MVLRSVLDFITNFIKLVKFLHEILMTLMKTRRVEDRVHGSEEYGGLGSAVRVRPVRKEGDGCEIVRRDKKKKKLRRTDRLL